MDPDDLPRLIEPDGRGIVVDHCERPSENVASAAWISRKSAVQQGVEAWVAVAAKICAIPADSVAAPRSSERVWARGHQPTRKCGVKRAACLSIQFSRRLEWFYLRANSGTTKLLLNQRAHPHPVHASGWHNERERQLPAVFRSNSVRSAAHPAE